MLDYYTLQRTLEMLKESPNDEYTAQDLAILCRQGILTPVFAYNRYCMEILEYYYDSGKPEQPSIGRSPEPMTKHFHDGYLTDKHLLSLLDKSMDKLKLFSAMTYKSDGSGWEIELVTNDGYTVTRESLLFPSEQVQSYIASRQTNEQQRIAELESELSDKTAKDYQVTIGLLLDLLLNKSTGFDNNGKDLPALFSSQTKLIDDIADQKIYGQGKSKLDSRFSDAKKALIDKRKK